MRRAAFLVVVASASAACGKFLGLDEADSDETPAPDASSEATSLADASSTVEIDAARVCEKITEDFGSYTTSDELFAKGWRRFRGTPTECAQLHFDGGAFVTDIPSSATNDASSCTTNAGVFRWFEGGVRTIECSFDVRASSFDAPGTAEFFEYRVVGTSYSQYSVSAGVQGEIGAVQIRKVATGAGQVDIDQYIRDTAQPDAGVFFRVRARLDLGGNPTFVLQWRDSGGPPLMTNLPDPGTPPNVQLYVGATETLVPRTIAIDNVTCEACR